MEHNDIPHPLFREAIAALDAGDGQALDRLLTDNPVLAGLRLDTPAEGYFSLPYLLWFIADNPIRRGKLAPNIVELAGIILHQIKLHAPHTLQFQLDYALGLVATGRIPRECGVQPALIDWLIDNGATPGNGIGALAHGNPEAARQLIARGGRMTLAAAAGLGEMATAIRLLPDADTKERQLALVIAAFYGRTEMLSWLLAQGVDPNVYPEEASGFHTHATALHQAVSSGSPEAVRLLTGAGANTTLRDRIYQGTPLGWAEHLLSEETTPAGKASLTLIAEHLRQAR